MDVPAPEFSQGSVMLCIWGSEWDAVVVNIIE
jgi:hypothetical protein